jgi:hypothetical protein
MKKHFVLAVGPISPEEEKAITAYLQGKHAWWHWIGGFWLIIDSSEKLTAETIRDHVHTVAPSARILVLEVQRSSDWAGIGPQTKEKDMFRWIQQFWLEALEEKKSET